MAAPPLKSPRTCSQCGNNGHNVRTCAYSGSVATVTGFILFGVRLTAAEISPLSSTFRKSMSMNNLSQYESPPQDSTGTAAYVSPSGYASDEAVLASSGSHSRERKRGVPWTEEEHRLFLMGLKSVGKGDWRGIARNFVKTRTPTQVASHAQKYFLRRTNLHRHRRRSSLFDITTDVVTNPSSIEDQSFKQDQVPQAKPPTPKPTNNQNGNKVKTYTFPKPFTTTILPTPTKLTPPLVPHIPILPSSNMANLSLNHSPSSSRSNHHGSRARESESFLSLRLSSSPLDEESPLRVSTFGGLSISDGDSIISVA